MKKIINYQLINIILLILIFFSLNYLKNISDFKFEIIKNLFNKNWSPQFSIYKPEVFELKEILKKNQITRFNFSKDFLNSFNLNTLNSEKKYIYYRSITYSYPILFSEKSEYVIFEKKKFVDNECEIIDEANFIYLAKC